MGITTEEFISSFHALKGTTIGERRKNLNLLLSYTKTEGGELDFSSIHPETPLEEKFKLEALIYLKRVPELLEVLKSENPIFIQRILKISWFLKEAFRNISGEYLANSIFPYISYQAKVKLLNKLAFHLMHPLQGDLYFKAIEMKYGLYLATKLLPSCSDDLIMSCVKTNKIKILPRQLLIIVKRHPKIIESILKELSSYVKVETEYKNVFICLAHQDTLLFLKLQNEYNLSINLGWRVTDKVVQWKKRDVIQNPDKFYKFLHNKQIAKSLHQDFKDLYVNLFPPSLNQFKRSVDEIVNILRHAPLKMRDANLLLTNFERLYGGHLWDHSDLISSELLDIMPASELESNVKPENRPNSIPEEKWYSYMKTEKSISYLKKTISLTSDIQARVKLVQFLVETCRVNKDRATLAGVCNYVVSRHRNDHISVRLGFLNKLMKSFKLSSLEEQHWTPVNELIKIFALNDEQFYHSGSYLEGYIYFRLEHNLPIEQQITEWVKGCYANDLKILQEYPQFEKRCLLALGEVIPKVFEAVNLEQYSVGFLQALMNWNKRHPEDQISLYGYSSMLNCLKRMVSEENNIFNAETVLKYLFSTKNNLEQGDGLLKLYFARKDIISTDYDIMKCLMRIEPSIIVHNINAAVRRLLNLYYKNVLWSFWSYCRYYTHLEIPQKIVDVCLAVLEEKSNDNEDVIMAKNAVAALSHLMTAHEFKRFSVPHYPSKLRKSTKSKEGEKTYKIQQNIGLCLRNVSPPSSVIESILMFCKEDCVRLVQGSLYSVCDTINEDKLLQFLNELGDQTVLLRKHAMHLTFRVLDKQQIYSLLNKYMQTEKNASVRKLIFRKVFGYFLTNPDDYSWELVKINVNAVDVKDREAFDVLMQTEKVPPHYFTQYIPFTWDVLNRLPGPESEIESNKGLILSSIKVDDIPSLPKEFCIGIIEKHLFKCEDEILTYFQSAVQTFTCRYIIYCQSKEEQEDRLNSIFPLLKNYISLTWHNSVNMAEARNCVANFVKSFCLDFLTDSRLNAEILETFDGLWNSTLKPHDAFDGYLHLQFTVIRVERLTISEIGQKLAVLCESLAYTYGGYMLEAFCNEINAFLQYFLHNSASDLEENRYELIESFVNPDRSATCLTLAVLLLRGHEPTTLRMEEKYKAIIEVLEKSSDPVVRLHLHSHFREIKYGS